MNITLPEDLERPILDMVMGERFASADELVTDAVRDYLRRRKPPQENGGETAYDTFRRAGLIGILDGSDDLPDDLSTNPIHMEGFGEHRGD